MTSPHYLQKTSTSQKFTMLVAHHRRASDPSKGVAGNPEPLRQGFEMQVISGQKRSGFLGNVEPTRLPSVVIKVNSTDYFNQRTAVPPPYYDFDEIRAFASDMEKSDLLPSLLAGEHFGQTIGNGAGAVADLASELATALNDLSLGVIARVSALDNTKVEVLPALVDDNIILSVVSYSYLILNGNPPFTIEDTDGNTIYDPAVGSTAVGTVVAKSQNIKPITSL
jgi:hypothetical protein